MRIRLLLLCALSTAALHAQSLSITSPTSGATWTGWTGQQFTVSLNAAPSAVQVCYAVDANPAENPGADPLAISGNAGALYAAGCSNSAPFSFPVNTFWWADNTAHTVSATAYDSLGNVVATSAPVTFAIANTWPVSCGGSAPQFSATASTPFSSSWSGEVNVTGTVTGACASDTLTFNFYLDGVLRYTSPTVTSGSYTAGLDTTAFPNGQHTVGVTVLDATNQVTYSTGQWTGVIGAAGEQSNIVTLSNGAVPMEVRNASSATAGGGRTLYIAPLASVTLTPTLVNTDQSSAPGRTFYFWSSNTAVASVSPASGSTTTVTGVAQGAAQIFDMAATTTVSDVLPFAGITSFFQSVTLGAHPDWINRMFVVTSSANGCIPGTYSIHGAWPPGPFGGTYGAYAARDPLQSADAGIFTSTSSGPCTIAIGQTRVAWAQVNSTNGAIAHFSNTGSILQAYTPGSSIVLNDVFQSFIETQSQQYPVPYLTSYCNSGFNALETGYPPTSATQWTGSSYSSPSVMAATLASYLQSEKSIAAGGPCNPMLWLTGDNIFNSLASVYAAAQGVTSGRNGSTWSPSGIATAWQTINTLNAGGPPYIIGMTMADEQPFSATPMQGPTTLGGTTNLQNWLGSSGSIVCTSVTCTVNTATSGPAGAWSVWAGYIIITGSTQGFNNAAGTCYAVTSLSSSQFTFPNSNSVRAGTYTYANDPTLRINTSNACQWYTPPLGSSATDFTQDDALAYIKQQIDSVSNHLPSAPSMQGETAAYAAACVNGGVHGPCGQFLTESGTPIYAWGDFDDQYYTHIGGCEVYLTAHSQLNGNISDNPACGLEELPHLRTYYGSYDPALPMETITQGTSANTGYASAQPIGVVSCMGNTITFAGPHHIVNFLPGWAKLWITGSSDPNCNKNFYILSAPTSTSLTVAYAATSQTCNDTGSGSCGYQNGGSSGTITFANGDSYPISQVQATGTVGYLTSVYSSSGTVFNYGPSTAQVSGTCSTATNTAILRHRGQNFTLSNMTGSAASYLNSTTFNYNIENLAQPTGIQGQSDDCANFFREIPVLNGTGGSANIVPDGSFIPGRNPWTMLQTNSGPDQAFLSVVGAMLARAAGHRFYQMQPNPNAYNPVAYSAASQGGWASAAGSASNVGIFGQNTLNNQLYAHPNVESGMSVPVFHAGSEASRMWTRLAKYYLGATALDAIDYGPEVESGTFQSSYGFLHIVANFSNGTETRSVNLTPYETAGQSVILWIADATHGIQPLTVIAPGTSPYSLTLSAGQAAYFLFPINFTSELNLPTVALRLADVPNATAIVASCGYDPYLLSNAAPMNLGGGTGGLVTAQLRMDKTIGPIYCTLSYIGSSNQLLGGGPKSAPVTF